MTAPAIQAATGPRGPALATTLDTETCAARAELARGDSKASALLGFAGTGFSLLAAISAAVSSHLALIAQIGLWLAVAALAASVAMLLWVIRPVIPSRSGTGVVAHATTSPERLLATLTAEHNVHRRAADVIMLSHLAVTKYKRLRTAVHLMYAALAILLLTLPFGR
ncbi:Pycsar system effector family protein [Streptosporangium sp. G11]|uniref:Pycsar system effector family protein n=1 Tax=Streptosporangium sp. G11 TaxID=3436926 RepID=UPI003EB91204